MSDIGETAYIVLLSWMRGLVNWVWLLVSGRGGSEGWQWFLSNWKAWLALLLIIGLIADWLMWIVRWRPYRLLIGRLSRKKTPRREAWDAGVGYYDPEIPSDSEPLDWTELTMSTLSEADPHWADGLKITEPDPNDYYAEDPDESMVPQTSEEAQAGYWEEMPDESPYAQPQAPEPTFDPGAYTYGRPGGWPDVPPQAQEPSAPSEAETEAFAIFQAFPDTQSFQEAPPALEVRSFAETAAESPLAGSRRRRRTQYTAAFSPSAESDVSFANMPTTPAADPDASFPPP